MIEEEFSESTHVVHRGMDRDNDLPRVGTLKVEAGSTVERRIFRWIFRWLTPGQG